MTRDRATIGWASRGRVLLQYTENGRLLQNVLNSLVISMAGVGLICSASNMGFGPCQFLTARLLQYLLAPFHLT